MFRALPSSPMAAQRFYGVSTCRSIRFDHRQEEATRGRRDRGLNTGARPIALLHIATVALAVGIAAISQSPRDQRTQFRLATSHPH
jgi:hypothetical protein